MSTSETLIPDTLEALKQQHSTLKDMPEFIPASEFTALQSADFAVAGTAIQEQVDVLNRKASTPTDRALALRTIIAHTDWFFKSIAKNTRDYDEWVKGRTAADLFDAFTALYGFYAQELGKSESSSNGSTDTRTN